MIQVFEKILNALLALILCGILFAALGVQYIGGEEPCPLCFLQRIGMISVAMGALLNLRFGVRIGHYAISLLSSVFGASVSLRQISLHVCPQFSTFGVPVLGYSLYSWAFLVFCCSIVGIGLLMFFYDPQKSSESSKKLSLFSWIVIFLVFFVALFNVFSSFDVCGFGFCDE